MLRPTKEKILAWRGDPMAARYADFSLAMDRGDFPDILNTFYQGGISDLVDEKVVVRRFLDAMEQADGEQIVTMVRSVQAFAPRTSRLYRLAMDKGNVEYARLRKKHMVKLDDVY